MLTDHRQAVSYRESANVLLTGRGIGDWKLKGKPLSVFSNGEKFKFLKL